MGYHPRQVDFTFWLDDNSDASKEMAALRKRFDPVTMLRLFEYASPICRRAFKKRTHVCKCMIWVTGLYLVGMLCWLLLTPSEIIGFVGFCCTFSLSFASELLGRRELRRIAKYYNGKLVIELDSTEIFDTSWTEDTYNYFNSKGIYDNSDQDKTEPDKT